MFNTIDKFTDLRIFLNKYKIVGTFFWSRFGTQPVKKIVLIKEPNLNLISVVGKGIKCPKIGEPSKLEVD